MSNAVTENFAAGVMERLGFGYDRLRELRPDVVYVSNCGFGQTGPYRAFKSWGPIAQAVSGMTHTSGLAGHEPAGWGYSYMDHSGAYVMGIALLAALYHQRRTGEGQWVDVACIEGGIAMAGPAVLDATVNGRLQREEGAIDSNRSPYPAMAPHGIYPCRDADTWVAIACRHDEDWSRLADVIGEAWAKDDALDRRWPDASTPRTASTASWRRGPPSTGATTSPAPSAPPASRCAPVQRPSERCDDDAENAAWGLWPTVAARQARPGARRRAAGAPVGHRVAASSGPGRSSARTTSRSTPRCSG